MFSDSFVNDKHIESWIFLLSLFVISFIVYKRYIYIKVDSSSFLPMHLFLFIICLLYGSVRSSEIMCSSSDVSGIDLSGKQTTEEHVQAVIDFWTDERLKSAKPKSLLRVDSLSRKKDFNRQPTYLQKLKLDKYPVTVGKVFFVDGNNNYACSASVVTSDSKDMLFTAGHCVFSTTTSKYVKNFVFIPQYNTKNRPYGTWPARCLYALSDWVTDRNYDYDVAVVLLHTVNGQHIQDVVGGQGVGFNHGHVAVIYAFGYPSNYYDGEIMTYCAATKMPRNYSNFHGDRLPCSMTHGASGGPWFESYDESKLSGIQTSVNSFIVDSDPNHVYGPHFDFVIQRLYERVDNGTETCPSRANNLVFSLTILFTLTFLQYLHISFMK